MQATIVFEKNWAAVHDPAIRYIINSGSSRSSKTHSIIQLFYFYAYGNAGKKLAVFRETKKACKDTVLGDMKKVYPYLKGYDRVVLNLTDSIYRFPNGSEIYIEGTDDVDKVHGYQSDIIWVNESYTLQEETFRQLTMRCAGKVILDLNPKENHFSDDLSKRPNALLIHSTFKDNPFCPPEQKKEILSRQPVSHCDIVTSKVLTEIEARQYDIAANEKGFTEQQLKELSRCLQNEYQNSARAFNWEVYGLGIKGERPNRIFHWERIPVSKYLEIDAPVYYGCDWGTVDPWGIVEAKYLDGNLYLREKNYLSENELRPTIPVTELARINQEGETSDEKNEAVGLVRYMFTKLGIPKDRPVICDTNRPIKGHALRKGGWQAIPAMKKKGSIIDGIDLLLGMNVFYTDDSPNIEMEQENYSRKVDTNGVVLEEAEDVDNHLIDPARYIAIYLQKIGIIRGA